MESWWSLWCRSWGKCHRGGNIHKIWHQQNGGWWFALARSVLRKQSMLETEQARPRLIPTLGTELKNPVCPNDSGGQVCGQLRLRLDQAAFYTTQQGESKHCCHPSQPIQSVGNKSAWRPGSCGSGKMECDGLVFTNSRGAPLLRHASHHSLHSTESSPSPHSIWFSHIKIPPPPDTPRFIPRSSPHKPILYASPPSVLLCHPSRTAVSRTLV